MAFFNERDRQRRMEERELSGESLWTVELQEPTRVKLLHSVNAILDANPDKYPWSAPPIDSARTRILREEGLIALSDSRNPQEDVTKALLRSPVPIVLSLLEALALAFEENTFRPDYGKERRLLFENMVNEVFRSDRNAFEFIDGEILPFSSREIHVEVVEPALRLLSAGPAWASVEIAYQKALREIDQDPSDAITDAGTALQEALVLCGATGNALGPLAKSAVNRRLLAPHDSGLTNAIEKIVHWVSADRSELGDAHKVGAPDRDDAWFTVHVVGALILRLSRNSPRGT